MTDSKIDFSPLDPRRDHDAWEARLSTIVSQVKRPSDVPVDLSEVRPFQSPGSAELAIGRIVAQASWAATIHAPTPATVSTQASTVPFNVLRLAPRAVVGAFIAAAASWTLVLFTEPQAQPIAATTTTDPVYGLIEWVNKDEQLSPEAMLAIWVETDGQ